MNLNLTLAVFFTFLFVIAAIQSLNYHLAVYVGKMKNVKKLNSWMPFVYITLASVFWGLA